MEKIVFLDRETVRANFRKPSFAHKWQEFSMTQPDEVLERLYDATIAVTNKVQLREATLVQLPNLRMIAVAATGTDCVDTIYCRENGITVSNVRNYSVTSVPEHVFALILALRRNLFAYHEDVRKGKWQQSDFFCRLDYPITELHNSTIGIVGYGSLGHAVEKIARAFNMKVLLAEHKTAEIIREGRTSFEQVLRESDIITLHCPLTNETKNLIGAEELEKMKSSSLLINCGRGGLVNENALVEALRNKKISGAGIDVLTAEPPRNGNPLLDYQFPNLIVTPHNAWASETAMQTLADILIDNLEAFVGGHPRNVVG